MNDFGNSREEHERRVQQREQEIAENATLTGTQLAQENEVRKLSKRWHGEWKDMEVQASRDEKSVIQLLNGEIPQITKGDQVIPAHAAVMADRKIYMSTNRDLGIEATNMKGLTESDMALVGYAIQGSVLNSFKGHRDLYDPGTGISSYATDSTQRPSERDMRLRSRKYVARLPLSMTAARVVPEMKSTFKLTQYDHEQTNIEGNDGVWHNAETQPTPMSTATVNEWTEGMLPCKGALGFSAKNINEGEYTLQALSRYTAEWSISAERVMTLACTNKIRTSGTIDTVNLDFNALSNDDLLKIALTYTFSEKDYMITTIAISQQATYEKYANISRGDQYQEMSMSDLGMATGRDNFRNAADRDVFAHPDGAIAVDTMLGWDAMDTINIHMLGTNQTSAMERKLNPEMYCYYWGLEFGTSFERESGDPRVLFN